jgi:Cu-Zn family superoxide dismutase
MPPLFSSGGRAFLVFLTNRFKVRDVVGRTVVIHAGRDDFTTQPSGDSGKKIACGVITA